MRTDSGRARAEVEAVAFAIGKSSPSEQSAATHSMISASWAAERGTPREVEEEGTVGGEGTRSSGLASRERGGPSFRGSLESM